MKWNLCTKYVLNGSIQYIKVKEREVEEAIKIKKEKKEGGGAAKKKTVPWRLTQRYSMYLWRFSYKIEHAFSTFYTII